jgi:hypothetical protein
MTTVSFPFIKSIRVPRPSSKVPPCCTYFIIPPLNWSLTSNQHVRHFFYHVIETLTKIHPCSNLNWCFFLVLCAPAVSKRGQWSESASIQRSRACIVTRGYFASQSVYISTWSRFSYAGDGRMFAQLNCRPIIGPPSNPNYQ